MNKTFIAPLENGKIEPLVKLLTDGMQAGLRQQFKQAVAKKNFATDDVAAGQENVKNYPGIYSLCGKDLRGCKESGRGPLS
jgi:hypothetical protein